MIDAHLLEQALLTRAAAAFPRVSLPSQTRLVVDPGYPGEHEYVLADLMEFDGREPSERDVRRLSQCWHHLQPDGWKWALARYLPHCLLAAAQEDLFTTEFLLYALDPGNGVDANRAQDAVLRIATFSDEQVDCLLDFVGWVATTELGVFAAEDIAAVRGFLEPVSASRRGTTPKSPPAAPPPSSAAR